MEKMNTVQPLFPHLPERLAGLEDPEGSDAEKIYRILEVEFELKKYEERDGAIQSGMHL